MKKYKPHPELEATAKKDADNFPQIQDSRKAHEVAFLRGAMWYERQVAPEIAELVGALRELNDIVRSNFGINHAKASELLKKYEQ